MEQLNPHQSRRLATTLQHIESGQGITTFPLEVMDCNASQKDEKSVIVANSIEQPFTIDIDSKIPNDVYLFPLYTRPIFPYVRVNAVPRQLLTQGGSAPTVDKIKKVLERLTSEANGRPSPPPIKKSAKDENKGKRVAFYRGPIVVTDRSFVDSLIKLKNSGETHVALCLARSSSTPVSKIDDVFSIGVLAMIEVVDTKDPKSQEVVLTGTHRILISLSNNPKPIAAENPSASYFKVAVKELKDIPMDKENPKNRALLVSVISQITELNKIGHPLFKDQLELLSHKIEQRDPSELADLSASLTTTSGYRLQQVLAELNVMERLKKVQVLLLAEIEVCKLVTELKKTTGGGPTSPLKKSTGTERNNKIMNEFKDRLKNLKVPEHAMKVIEDEMNKLGSLDPTYNATEHYTCRNYLNWLTSMPWGVYSNDNLDINDAEKIMEEDHYGIPDVKQRILEFIAVASLKGSLSGKILCFVGPPGTGKTSFGKSIAKATKRQFARFSVGGMHDVAEIKGHRRTYVGALPGKLVQALKQAKTSNPVILIDEIDKLSKSWDGDPSSALLEVLDPEQNSSYLDHYLDVSYDLSKVLFICTANSLDTIPRPLLDRMEVIHLSGYFLDEKIEIAKTHLVPKILNDSGVKQNQILIDDSALYKLIAQYCREAGVRTLQKQLEKIYRKVAMKIARKETERVVITQDNLEQFVGKPKFTNERLYDIAPAGVVTGLAYNQLGGALIWIESALIHHRKAGLKNTGKLGKVMKESIEIAFTFSKKFLNELDSNNNFFDTANIHIHFPEGATPKDGPSAGCAIVTSFISLALNRPVKPNLAMTGEITLTGKVLPIGGVKEKLMAAKRSGINEIILPERNRKDYEELVDQLKQGMNPHFVEHYNEIFSIAFPNPLKESYFQHERPVSKL